MEMIWDDVLSAEDRTVIHQAGYEREGAASWDSRSVGSYPALIVIDMQHLAFGPNAPILDAIQTHRTAMGEIAWRALDDILPFVDFCRSKNLPVIFTRVIPHSRTTSDPAVGIIEPLQPREGELVLDKNYSSAFYGTGLLTYLNRKRVDTLIVTGNTTSGCVRVTAIDARQMGFHVIVPQ